MKNEKTMKTKIVIGSLMVVFILMITPLVSATQGKSYLDVQKKNCEIIQNDDFLESEGTKQLHLFPLMYIFYKIVYNFRMGRAHFWSRLAYYGFPHWGLPPDNPEAYAKYLFWMEKAQDWALKWHVFGDVVGWW